MQRSLRVGVVGLGTAGLSTSIFLGRLNHKVDIFEATSESDLDIVVGAGIGVQPIGLTVLNRLGVLGDILDRGSRIDRLHSTTREGKTVLDLKYADFRPELHGVGLHRDTLFRSLYDEALSTNGNVQVVPGTKVVNVSRGPNGSYLEVKGSAEKEGPYDLVVVADGRDSLRKNMSHVKQYESKYEYGCLWSILPDVTGEFTTGKGGGDTSPATRFCKNHAWLAADWADAKNGRGRSHVGFTVLELAHEHGGPGKARGAGSLERHRR